MLATLFEQLRSCAIALLVGQWGMALVSASPLEEPRLDRLSARDGLSQDNVHCVFQDSRGFLWIGSEDGLNRYDGREIRTFPEISEVNTSIVQIMEDNDGRLWLATWGDGLITLDLDTEEAIRHEPSLGTDTLNDSRIQSLFLDSEGVVWAGSMTAGLHRYDSERGTFQHFGHNPDDPESLSDPRVWSIAQTEPGFLWLATSRGLDLFDIEKGKATRTPLGYDDRGAPIHLGVFTIVPSRSGALWLGARKGLYRLDPRTRIAEQYLPVPEWAPLLDLEIRVVREDHRGVLWLSTQQRGILMLNPTARRITRLSDRPKYAFSVSNLSVKGIYEDRGQVLWIATASGLLKTDLKPPKFHILRHIPGDPKSLPSNEISAIAEDPDGGFWIGAYGGGIARFLPESHTIQTFENGEFQDLEKEISALMADSEGRLWIAGKETGLYRLSRKPDRQVDHFRHDGAKPESLSSDSVRSLMEDRAGRIWLGTLEGPNLFDEERGRFLNANNHELFAAHIGKAPINTLFCDRAGNVWIGASRGLYRLDAALQSVRAWSREASDGKAGLSHDSVNCISEAPNGDIWVGARKGLNKIDPVSGEVTPYFAAEGPAKSEIRGVQIDTAGRLWLATANGLFRFEPATGDYRKYDVEDGLAGAGFTMGASFQASTGEIFFGGPSGLTWFSPDQVKDNPFRPEVALTGIAHNRQSLTNQPLFAVDRLTLAHDQNNFTIKFAALDFTSPDKNSFKYRLVGQNDNWADAGSDAQAVYTNLDPGSYVFQVRAANNDGVASASAALLEIVIEPPLWKTWWAFLIYILTFLSLWYLIHRARVASLEQRRRALAALVAERTAELRAKNEELGEKNRELLAFDEIVQTINKEVSFTDVMKSLIHQGLKLFRSTETGAFLVRDRQNRVFRFAASIGADHAPLEQITFSEEEADGRYLSKSRTLAKGVYLLDGQGLPSKPELARLRPPEAMLAISIVLNQEIEGILIFEIFSEPSDLESWDLEKLRRFRQHAISAVSKAKLVRDLTFTADHLKKTQEMLTDAARHSGMSEIAANTLHNLGNLLNSINTSADEIIDLNRDLPVSLLQRLSALLAEHIDNLPEFLSNHQQGRQVPEALQLIAETLSRVSGDIDREVQDLRQVLDQLKTSLSDQERHIQTEEASQAIALSSCLEEALRVEEPLLTSRDVTLVKDWSDLPRVMIPKSRFLRVLVNLINNAVDAMAESSGERRLTITGSRREDGSVDVTVADTGCGIAPENMTQLFRAGYTTKKRGSSFGLHYSANIMHELGGSIAANSDGLGCGATFTLTLPERSVVRKTA